MHRPTQLLHRLIVVVVLLLWAAIPNATLTLGQGVRTFVFGQSGDPVTLDPGQVEDNLSSRVTVQIYETLVELDGATTRVRPALAESWDVSPDGKEWTFHLRQSVTFHDGTAFDADAVKANFDRWQYADNPYHAGGTFIAWNDLTGLAGLVDHTEVVDPATFKVSLKSPSGPFLSDLAVPGLGIVSPAALQANAADLSSTPVGTGPFKFVEWTHGDHVTLAANDAYWGGRPQIDQVIVRSIPDNGARYFELQAGNIDLMEFPNPDDVNAAQSAGGLQVMRRPTLNVGYIDFNEFQPPFNDPRVRNALALATNRQRIVDALYGGSGIVAKGLIPPGMLGYDGTLPDIPYDPAQAKSLLAEAGFPTGFSTEFWYMPVDRAYYPGPQAIAQAICADWSAVGVKCDLKTKDWTAYLADARDHKFATWMLGGTGDTGDTDELMFYFFGTFSGKDKPSYNTWDNGQVRDLILHGQRSVNDDERNQLYQQAGKIIRAEMPKIPFAHTTHHCWHKPTFRGISRTQRRSSTSRRSPSTSSYPEGVEG